MLQAKEFILAFRKERNFLSLNERLREDETFRNELFLLLNETQYPFPEYVSWISVHFFEKNKMTALEFELLWTIFVKTENHTIQRNSLNALNFTHFELDQNGQVLNRVLEMLSNPQTLPANLYAGFKVLDTFYLKKYPELLPELKAICSNWKNSDKTSIRSMIRSFDKKYGIN